MRSSLARHVAFLRGINVGGHKIVKLADLKAAFESLGYEGVKTVLASGNVVFGAPPAGAGGLAREIEAGLAKALGQQGAVVVRGIDELRCLAAAEPFRDVAVTPETRLYVTFLPEPLGPGTQPVGDSPDGNFRIVHATDSEICSVLTVTPDRRTVDLMGVLEARLGKRITTRNWNTLARILKLEGGGP